MTASPVGTIGGTAGLANGDFDVQVRFSPVGGFLSGPFILNLALADFNGVNTSLTAFSSGSFDSGRVDGSGNLSFTAVPGVPTVPEASTLLLLGSSLTALGWFRRKARG